MKSNSKLDNQITRYVSELAKSMSSSTNPLKPSERLYFSTVDLKKKDKTNFFVQSEEHKVSSSFKSDLFQNNVIKSSIHTFYDKSK